MDDSPVLARRWWVRSAGHVVLRMLRALVRPVWNPLRGLVHRSFVHPLALVGPRVRFGTGCVIGRCRLDTMDAGGLEICIGHRTIVYSGVEVMVHGGRVEIGDDCLITRGVAILTGGHGFRRRDQRIREQPLEAADVSIGNDCWIGYRAVVLGGVTIGDGAVVPARPIGRRGEG